MEQVNDQHPLFIYPLQDVDHQSGSSMHCNNAADMRAMLVRGQVLLRLSHSMTTVRSHLNPLNDE